MIRVSVPRSGKPSHKSFQCLENRVIAASKVWKKGTTDGADVADRGREKDEGGRMKDEGERG